ncbi:MAG: helix-turn-helix domain-containing protein [Micromonosporaceae bacterium]
MTKPPSKTLRRRRLGAALRACRDAAGLTREDVGEKLDCSGSKITRMENADVGVRRTDLLALLDLYGVTDLAQREELLGLAKRSKETGWWQRYRTLPGKYLQLIELESVARSIRWYEQMVIPGLLQTLDYARAVIEATVPHASPDEVDRKVEARLNRQKVLTESSEPPECWIILDEAALHRVIGSAPIMHAQMSHLIELAKAKLVRLQVIPFHHGGHEAMTGAFTILRFDPPDPDIVYLEGLAGDIYLDQSEDLDRCSLVFDHLCAVAATPEQSRKVIAEAVRRFA